MKKLLSLLLIVLLLLANLTACNGSTADNDTENSSRSKTASNTESGGSPKEPVDYFTCIYTQDDYDAYIKSLNDLKIAAISGNDKATVENLFANSEEKAEFLSTQHSISNIVYYSEKTDEANEKFSEMDGFVTTAAAEYYKVYREIYTSSSPFKDILFADWTKDELTALSNLDIDEFVRTSDILNDILIEYTELDDGDPSWGDTVNKLYESFVKEANNNAKAWGYDNYYDYMTDNSYYRDYSDADRRKFRDNVIEYIVPMYDECIQAISTLNITPSDYNEFISLYSDSFKDHDTNYVDGFINTFDGSIKEKMLSLFQDNRILYGNENSIEAAFTSRLEYYDDTVCFFAEGYYQSISTIVHEMGHYVSLFNYDYAGTSFDLLETHSQGTEWLLLSYLDGKIADGVYDLYFINSAYSLFDLLIRCSIIDEFEETVYKAATPYTADEYDDLLESISDKYGYGLYEELGMENYIKQISIRNPVYYISYATSAIAAADFYVIAETESYEVAQEAYRKLQEGNPDEGFVYNLAYAGLSNPFKKETFIELCTAFTTYINNK